MWDVGCGMWDVGCGEWGVGCGEWDVGCGEWDVGCGMWDVGSGEWGVCGSVSGTDTHVVVILRVRVFGHSYAQSCVVAFSAVARSFARGRQRGCAPYFHPDLSSAGGLQQNHRLRLNLGRACCTAAQARNTEALVGVRPLFDDTEAPMPTATRASRSSAWRPMAGRSRPRSSRPPLVREHRDYWNCIDDHWDEDAGLCRVRLGRLRAAIKTTAQPSGGRGRCSESACTLVRYGSSAPSAPT